jgi:sodium-dependent dicarboxylate transporter 2/3/5
MASDTSTSSPWVRLASLLLGLGIVLIGVVHAPPEGLSVEGFRAMTLLGGAIVLWVLQPIDLAATALLGMAALPILGIAKKDEAFALFGNQAVFFVLGVFLIAAVLMQTGLATRAALTLLSRFDQSPNTLAGAVFAMSIGFCSVLVSHAVAAILFPILLEICRALDLPHGKSPFAKRLLLSMSWGSIVGSNLTFLSSVRLGLALGLLDKHNAGLPGAASISFLFWIVGALPIVLLMGVAVQVVLYVAHPSEQLDMKPAVALLRRKVEAMGVVKRDEKVAVLSLAVMLVGMVFFGKTLGFGTVAVFSAGMNFVFGSVAFQAVEKHVSWGIVLLFGGAVAMATAVENTHGVEWIINTVMPANAGLNPLVLVAIVAYICVIMTEFASNSAVIAALLPICMLLADRIGLPARAMVFATVIPAGLAFMLPTGTPAMAMVFSSGYLRPRDTVIPGLVLVHLGWLAILLVSWLWWPLIGLR